MRGCVIFFFIGLIASLIVSYCSDDSSEESSSVPSVQQESNGGPAEEEAEEEEEEFYEPEEPVDYPSVPIGDMIWTSVNISDADDGSFCYDDAPSCAQKGRLYTWYAAKRACGTGWHLPTQEEFEKLREAMGEAPGRKLKSDQTWESATGLDSFGFTAYATGFRDESGEYLMAGENAYFWTSTEVNDMRAVRFTLSDRTDQFVRGTDKKSIALSVRCVKGD